MPYSFSRLPTSISANRDRLLLPLFFSRTRMQQPAVSSQRSSSLTDPTYPLVRDIQLVILSMLYFFSCMYVVSVGNAVADRINPNNFLPVEQRQPLPDMIMQSLNAVFRKTGLPVNISDQFIMIATFSMLLRVFTMQTVPLTTAVFRRVLYVMGTVYLIRAMTITLTVLPNPLTECHSQPHPELLYDAWLIFTMKRTSCGDVFFSGHTIMFTLSMAVWTTYSRSGFLSTIFSLSAVLGMISLVASAYHYTIDIMFGYLVTMWVWNHYHWCISLPSFRATWWGRFLNRLDDPLFAEQQRRRQLLAKTSATALMEVDDENEEGENEEDEDEMIELFEVPVEE